MDKDNIESKVDLNEYQKLLEECHKESKEQAPTDKSERNVPKTPQAEIIAPVKIEFKKALLDSKLYLFSLFFCFLSLVVASFYYFAVEYSRSTGSFRNEVALHFKTDFPLVENVQEFLNQTNAQSDIRSDDFQAKLAKLNRGLRYSDDGYSESGKGSDFIANKFSYSLLGLVYWRASEKNE